MNNPREEIILGLKNVLNDSQDSGGSVVKNQPVNAGDPGLILGSGRPPGEGIGNPCQYSCLQSSMDRRTGWATGYGVAIELDMT